MGAKWKEVRVKNDISPGKCYLLRFAGAFIGAALGGIIWYAIVHTNHYAVPMATLVPLFTIAGYILPKGKTNKLFAQITVSSLAFLSIVISQFFRFKIIMENEEISANFKNYMLLLKLSNNFRTGEIYTLIIAVGSIFIGFEITPHILKLRENNK